MACGCKSKKKTVKSYRNKTVKLSSTGDGEKTKTKEQLRQELIARMEKKK